MRIGLIVYGLDRALSGISRYTLELVRALAALDARPDVVLLAAGGLGPLANGIPFGQVPLPGCRLLPALVAWGSLTLPRVIRRLGLDLVHDLSGISPFLLGAGDSAVTVTLHDVFAWSIPGHSTLADTLIYRHWLPRVLPRVNAVITDSNASRSDIEQYLPVDRSRLFVVPLGVHPRYYPRPKAESIALASRYGLPEGYFLFVGSVEERKNLRRLLQACARLWAAGEKRPLAVVGARRWKYSKILQTVQDLALESHVLFTGHVPDADLPALYGGADLFVFPSLYEGFGLPPLEAMACGTPVVTSNTSSLPEVVGDAAITVDPYDVEALAESMHRVLSDPDLADDLRQRGLERAAGFTWEQTARKTVEVYREVLS